MKLRGLGFRASDDVIKQRTLMRYITATALANELARAKNRAQSFSALKSNSDAAQNAPEQLACQMEGYDGDCRLSPDCPRTVADCQWPRLLQS